MPTTMRGAAEAILDGIGGPDNIASFTHCATRLRFELKDSSLANKQALESIPKVMGAVPQGGSHYQVVIGGDVSTVFDEINSLPSMKNVAVKSDAEIKAEARAKSRGKMPWLDTFFEYLSDSFRPMLGVLLGASLIIAFAAVLDAFGLVQFKDDNKSPLWLFVDAMWRSVFFFLPVMVAYNAGKKLRIDPWVPTAVILALMTPEFTGLKDNAEAVCTSSETFVGEEFCQINILGLPLQLPDYSGNVFVPLMMAVIAALVYKGFQKIIPAAVHMVFVPFLTLVIVIPITAFLIGPAGVWLGNTIGIGLAWMNGNVPFLFAILIPMLYPFLVPLGLHWPLNALMLVNIQTLGYDFIQGPMGAWNFACFGATAGVLALSLRDRDPEMRQTSGSALAAGLFGGISEPSLYGIHLRFKRIYPRMLVGCFTGGLTIAVLGMLDESVTTNAFVFTSIPTVFVFNPAWVYVIAITVAFMTSFLLIFLTDYRTPEEKADALARAAAARQAKENPDAHTVPDNSTAPAASATATATAVAVEERGDDNHDEEVAAAPAPKIIELSCPADGEIVELNDVPDAVFSSGALGDGLGIKPTSAQIVSPVAGTVATAMKTGHAYGLKTDDGVEVLVHIGIDTVKMKGEGFEQLLKKGERVEVGQPLANVDFAAVEAAGYDTTVLMTVTNSKNMLAVEVTSQGKVSTGETVMSVEK